MLPLPFFTLRSYQPRFRSPSPSSHLCRESRNIMTKFLQRKHTYFNPSSNYTLNMPSLDYMSEYLLNTIASTSRILYLPFTSRVSSEGLLTAGPHTWSVLDGGLLTAGPPCSSLHLRPRLRLLCSLRSLKHRNVSFMLAGNESSGP